MLVCDAGEDEEHGYFGELMAADALTRRLAGLVVDGAVRDGAALLASRFPVFHRGFAPHPCAKNVAPSVGQPIELAGVTVNPGDVVVADRDAVVVVAAAEWPEVAAQISVLEVEEDELRAALRRGQHLGTLLGLDVGEGS